MDPRAAVPHERSDPRATSRVFLENLGILALSMIPGGLIAATTRMRHASVLTYLALFAFLVLPLLHGIASMLAEGPLRRRGRHDLGAGLRRSGPVIMTIWLVTWILLLVLANR